MNVIGKTKDGFLCEVNKTEIEKYLNLYYNKMGEIKIGDTIDLSKGYDFYRDSIDAMRKTDEFLKAHKAVVEAIFTGISLAVKSEDI